MTGFLVPPHDVPALTKAMRQLQTDANLRARMGVAATAYAQANFGIDRMLDGMERVFERVARGHG